MLFLFLFLAILEVKSRTLILYDMKRQVYVKQHFKQTFEYLLLNICKIYYYLQAIFSQQCQQEDWLQNLRARWADRRQRLVSWKQGSGDHGRHQRGRLLQWQVLRST